MPEKLSKHKILETNVALAFACLIISFIFKLKIFTYAATAILLIALFIRPLSNLLARAWLALSKIIGFLNSRIILTVTFYGVLTPIAFLYRMSKGDSMDIDESGKQKKTLWHNRNLKYAPEDFNKTW